MGVPFQPPGSNIANQTRPSDVTGERLAPTQE